MRRTDLPSLLVRRALDPPTRLEHQLGESFERYLLAGIQRPKDLLDGDLDFDHQIPPSSMQQPPAKRQKIAVGLKIHAASAFRSYVFVGLQAYGFVRARRCHRYDAGNVTSAAEQVQLYPREDRQEGERIYQGKRARNSWLQLAVFNRPHITTYS